MPDALVVAVVVTGKVETWTPAIGAPVLTSVKDPVMLELGTGLPTATAENIDAWCPRARIAGQTHLSAAVMPVLCRTSSGSRFGGAVSPRLQVDALVPGSGIGCAEGVGSGLKLTSETWVQLVPTRYSN